MATASERIADEFAIRNLLNWLALLADGDDVDAYVACFTEDALWESPTAALRGRADIRAGAEERRREGLQGPGSNSCHVVTNQVVDIAGPDRAFSKSYLLFVTNTSSHPMLQTVARYDDTFDRTPAGWKLARRSITFG